MNKNIALLILIAGIMLSSCKHQTSLIQNPDCLADIQRMLEIQKSMTKNSQIDIWGVFKKEMTQDELQAMQFLYAYMPLSDLADYPSDFFLSNTKRSLEAKKETAWGDSLPEDVFLHFVLPVRVNNENLDSFRLVMYPEIKDRIKGLPMKDAALEINHWCHEKVNYRGTDGRTSAPLSTISKTFGRCGEESTFTVAAMRTAGIPARQVYTPRWAHTDDNHAWVEVWIDGKWYFLGACEPESELNVGWFNEPSRRTMLVHTRAYGRYFGKEDVIIANDRFSELNLTANYATVKTITFKVENSDGTPADSAKVEFKLYNYAEFFPIASAYTDKKGLAHLKTGMGDLLVWTSKNGAYAYKKLSVPEADTFTLTLKPFDKKEYSEMLDMVPPHAVKETNPVSEEKKAENNIRLALEDSIRNCRMATFKDSVWVKAFAQKIHLPFDSVFPIIKKSYGNWPAISKFLESNLSDYRHFLLPFASQLSDKDFSDTREFVLTDHLKSAFANPASETSIPEDIFVKYILSPRINIEFLSPWRSFLQKEMSEKLAAETKGNITVLTDWIRKNITIDNMANMHSRAPISPIGVFNLRVANSISRDIFFVAACRSFGIPARLNPETSVPEYWNKGGWILTGFDETPLQQPVKGTLQLFTKESGISPQYYLHFTIGIIKDGFIKTLEFEEGRKLTDFPAAIPMDTGRYVLITGNRMEDGSVLSSLTFFNILPGKLSKLPVALRRLPENIKPSGKLDLSNIMLNTTGKKPESIATLAKGKDMVLVLFDPDKEPSKHILNDLGPYVEHFNKWNGTFIFAMPKEKSGQAGVLKTYALPSSLLSGIDENNNLLEAVGKIYGSGLKDKLPLVLLCDNQGNVYLFSSGYKIGMGEQILKVTPVLTKVRESCAK